jgi:opacity protein-like surface antigen
MKFVRLCAVISSLAMTSGSFAAVVHTAAIDFISTSGNGTSSTSTRGYIFNVTQPVTVTGLSFFDLNSNGLNESHDVGLWSPSGSLLASATVPSGTAAPLDSSGKFRFVLLSTPVTLAVGSSYRTGGLFLVDSADSQFVNQTGLTNAPGVSYVSGAFINNTSATLTRPTNSFPSGIGGGSFVVPEPASLSMLCLAGLLMRRRR